MTYVVTGFDFLVTMSLAVALVVFLYKVATT